MTRATTEAVARVEKYLTERAKMRQCDPSRIHGLHGGDELREADLTVEDLRTLLEALSAPPMGEALGHAGEMPGSNGGFTMAVFKASDVPLGTPLYALAQPGSGGAGGIAENTCRCETCSNERLAALATTPAIRESGEGGSFSQEAKIPTGEAGPAVLAARQWTALVEGGSCVDPWEGLSLLQAALAEVAP